jgi:oligopeptide/dipeptide ABC transporter ATP-binding protein
MLVRLVEPTSGQILFQGSDLLALRAAALRSVRRSLQLVFQDPWGALDPRLSAGDAIFEPLRIHGLAAAREKRERVAALLTEVGLPESAAERFPHELSGGQRQRIGVARALASDPELLIADEPVSALDVSVRAQIVNLLAERQRERGLALLFIAHDLALVEQISDRIAVMYRGRIVETGPTRVVLERTLHPYTALLRASTPDLSRSTRRAPRGVGAELPSRTPSAGGCPFEARCPAARSRCREERPELREAESGVRVACHYPGEVHAAAPGDSGNWNFSRQAT